MPARKNALVLLFSCKSNVVWPTAPVRTGVQELKFVVRFDVEKII
jgi:hypothetical protein